jgi:hypothetical protein
VPREGGCCVSLVFEPIRALLLRERANLTMIDVLDCNRERADGRGRWLR